MGASRHVDYASVAGRATRVETRRDPWRRAARGQLPARLDSTVAVADVWDPPASCCTPISGGGPCSCLAGLAADDSMRVGDAARRVHRPVCCGRQPGQCHPLAMSGEASVAQMSLMGPRRERGRRAWVTRLASLNPVSRCCDLQDAVPSRLICLVARVLSGHQAERCRTGWWISQMSCRLSAAPARS